MCEGWSFFLFFFFLVDCKIASVKKTILCTHAAEHQKMYTFCVLPDTRTNLVNNNNMQQNVAAEYTHIWLLRGAWWQRAIGRRNQGGFNERAWEPPFGWRLFIFPFHLYKLGWWIRVSLPFLLAFGFRFLALDSWLFVFLAPSAFALLLFACFLFLILFIWYVAKHGEDME